MYRLCNINCNSTPRPFYTLKITETYKGRTIIFLAICFYQISNLLNMYHVLPSGNWNLAKLPK